MSNDFNFGFDRNARRGDGATSAPSGSDDGTGGEFWKRYGKWMALAAAGLVGLFLLVSSFVIVPSGNLGVVTHFGAVQDEILPEGLHMVTPVQTKVINMDMRVQKLQVETTASSSDLQVIRSVVVLNFVLDKAKVQLIFRELGPYYGITVIEPAIQESFKAATAKFTAEQLITKRQEVKETIMHDVQARLMKYNIVVSDFSITDFDFSDEFNKAIEGKQVAEQLALRAKNDLERIRTEAEQAQVKAKGEADANLELARAQAEAQRLLRQTLTPELVQMRAIDKWNGELPQVSSGATPFISLEGLRK